MWKYCNECYYQDETKSKDCKQCGEKDTMVEFTPTSDDLMDYAQNQ